METIAEIASAWRWRKWKFWIIFEISFLFFTFLFATITKIIISEGIIARIIEPRAFC